MIERLRGFVRTPTGMAALVGAIATVGAALLAALIALVAGNDGPPTAPAAPGTAAGAPSSSASPIPCPDRGHLPTPVAPTLIPNPSFETNDDGWGNYGAAVLRVPCGGASQNTHVAKVTRAEDVLVYTIDSLPGPIASTRPGCMYTATAHVAAASSSSVGEPAMLIIRESTTATEKVATARSTMVPLTTEFQELTARFTTQGTGNVLDVYVAQEPADPGDEMYADDFSLVLTNTC